MSSARVSPEKDAEIKDLAEAIREAIDVEINELAAESLSMLFYPNGTSITRIVVERDPQGHVVALTLKDDRHEERWERKGAGTRTHTQP